MAEIRLTGVNKVYPGGTHAVHDVDLHIADGEFMIMVGPSGCAKSTILRMIAGLETPTAGSVEIGGRVVNHVPPRDRDIAMVFQSYALYPHMTVRENMAFGLRLRRMPPSEIDQRVAEAAGILGLDDLLDRLPKAMSGGQRQRVAMGRAIVREPQAFLMDEPLSNLDAKLRVQMRTQIARLHQRLGTTTVYVTHDQVEAMTLGQRICILRRGVIQQVDTPFMVYTNPANVFVGGFIGSPGMNFMSGTLIVHDGSAWLQVGEATHPLPQSVTDRLHDAPALHGRRVIAGIRPEHLHEATGSDPQECALPVHVELIEAMGAESYAYFTAEVEVPDLSALSDTHATSDTFVARLPAGARAVAGHGTVLGMDMQHVHLFDPDSQLTLLAPMIDAGAAAADVESSAGLAHGSAHPTYDARPAAPARPTRQPRPTDVPAPARPRIEARHVDGASTAARHGATIDADPGRVAAVFDAPHPPTRRSPGTDLVEPRGHEVMMAARPALTGLLPPSATSTRPTVRSAAATGSHDASDPAAAVVRLTPSAPTPLHQHTLVDAAPLENPSAAATATTSGLPAFRQALERARSTTPVDADDVAARGIGDVPAPAGSALRVPSLSDRVFTRPRATRG